MKSIQFTEQQQQAYGAEQDRNTLVYGRILAWVIALSQCGMLYQDIAIMQLGWRTVAWRLLEVAAAVYFLVLAGTRFKRDLSHVCRWHIVQLSSVIVAMCGLTMVVARLPDAHPSYVYGVIGALTIGVVGVGIAAAGARQYLGLIYGVPIALLMVGLVFWSKQSAKEIALLANAIVIGAAMAILALVHEHLARREFKMRWLAEQRRTQVEDYAEQLEVVNRDLEHFAGIASHELQQPLVTVKWWLYLVKKGLRQQGCYSGMIEEHMSNASITVSNMSRLIARLLSYTAMDKDDLHVEDLELSEIVHDVMTSLEALLTETQADIRVDELPRVRGDRYLLGQLFQNLIENAVKYAEPSRGLEICVSAEAEDHYCRIEVSDNGRGIAPDASRDIFAPRIRLRTEEKTRGTGLGLATCRKIVNLHGGTIGVVPNQGGSTFWFTLPGL